MTFLPRGTEHTPAGHDGSVEFVAEVTDFRELGRHDGVRLFQIALTRTAFAPGQCSGWMTATSRAGHLLEVEVLDVEEDAEGTLWHTTRKPLQPGVTVRGCLFPREGIVRLQ